MNPIKKPNLKNILFEKNDFWYTDKERITLFNGKLNGEYTVYYFNGTRYEGGWKDSEYHGYGTLFNKEGLKVYQGELENGAFHGKGKSFNGKEVMIYEGEFKDD